jgi:hypothetical protein
LLLTLLPEAGPVREDNLAPLRSVQRLSHAVHRSGLFGHAARIWAFNIAGNLLLFLPVGWLAYWSLRVRRRSRWLAAGGAGLLSLTLSVAIEAYHFNIPQRTADVDDVIFNLVGAACGIGLGWWRERGMECSSSVTSRETATRNRS